MKSNKNVIKVFEPTSFGYRDSGLRITITRFRHLSAFWRSVLKAKRLELGTPLEEWDAEEHLIISEPYAGHGFVEDNCLQDDCPYEESDRRCGLSGCQWCHCASRNGNSNYFYVPRGARIWAKSKRAREIELSREQGIRLLAETIREVQAEWSAIGH